MKNHFLLESIAAGSKSHAYWSKTPGGKLLIFVHGFRLWQDPEASWHEFPERIRTDDALASHDIVFFGYKATPNINVNTPANQLYSLLDALLSGQYTQI